MKTLLLIACNWCLRLALLALLAVGGPAHLAHATEPTVPPGPSPARPRIQLRGALASVCQLPAACALPSPAYAPPTFAENAGRTHPAPFRQLGLGLPSLRINRGLMARLRPRPATQHVRLHLSRHWVYNGEALWFRGSLGFAVVQLPTTPAQPDAERRLRSLAQERQLTADANDRQRQQETPASPSRRTHAQAQRRLNTGGLLGAANYWLNPDTWLYYMEQNRPGVHITFRF